MRMRLTIVVAWLLCGVSGTVLAAGLSVVRSSDGALLASGNITQITPTKVLVTSSGKEKEVSVNDIAQIAFEGEPGQMKTARKHIAEEKYEEALEVLEKLQLAADANPEVHADYDYYKALANGKLVMHGSGNPVEAGRMLVAFITAHASSYHYFDAVEMLGDLLILAGRYDNAIEYYNRLAQAPWPNRKIRAAAAMGRTHLLQGKLADAAKAFDAALAVQTTGDEAEALRGEAALGKLRCQAETGKPDVALKEVEATIAKIEPEQKSLLALAYNIRGLLHRKLGQEKEALMDYLHVEVLYADNADAHAEALAALAELFAKTQQPDRANRAKQTLLENYPHSPWNKR